MNKKLTVIVLRELLPLSYIANLFATSRKQKITQDVECYACQPEALPQRSDREVRDGEAQVGPRVQR